MAKCKDNEFDLAICDPEYGGNDAIGIKNNKNMKNQAAARKEYKVFKNIQPCVKYWQELFRISKNQIVFGCNYYTNINLSGGRLVWDKKGTAFGRAEMAYLCMTKSVNIFEYTWNGMIQENMKDKEKRIHVCQKPIALYKWLLTNYAKPGQTIFDSHTGSSSIRIACYDLGFDFIGCELDKSYWTAQEKRFKNHIQQQELFDKKEIQGLIY